MKSTWPPQYHLAAPLAGETHHKPAGRHFLTTRILIFSILEISFLFLAAWCLVHPLQLSLSPTDSLLKDAKSIVTATSVVWQAIAGLMAKDIATRIFSAEWAALYHRTGILQPGQTDIVSTMTSGLLDQIRYSLSRQPSSRFRVSFVIILLLLLLGPIGPSTITVSTVPVDTVKNILVANLSENGLPGPGRLTTFQRVERILSSEMFDHLTVGYQTVTERTLVPWSVSTFDLATQQGLVVNYDSDVVTYDYHCHWTAPTSFDQPNEDGAPQASSVVNSSEIRGIIPQDTPKLYTGVAITPIETAQLRHADDPPTNDQQRSAFLFLGGISGMSPILNLDNRPALQIQSPHVEPGGVPHVFNASILVCDPQFNLQHASIMLNPGNRTIRAAIKPDEPLVGNIARDLLTQSLAQVWDRPTIPPIDHAGAASVSDIAAALFLQDYSVTANQLSVLDLDKINNNMNNYLEIAGKGFLSGIIAAEAAQEFQNAVRVSAITQQATLQMQRLALTTSKPFFISLSIIVGILEISLVTLLVSVNPGQLQPFNLEAIEKAIKEP